MKSILAAIVATLILGGCVPLAMFAFFEHFPFVTLV